MRMFLALIGFSVPRLALKPRSNWRPKKTKASPSHMSYWHVTGSLSEIGLVRNNHFISPNSATGR